MTDEQMYDVLNDSLMRSFAYETLIEFAELHNLDKELVTERFVELQLKRWKDG